MEVFEQFEDDGTQPISDSKGAFPFLKKLSSIATNKPEVMGDVDWGNTLQDAYQHVAQLNNLLDYKAGEQLAAQGMAGGVEQAAATIAARLEYLEQNNRNQVNELNEVAQAAIERIAVNSPAVVLNNKPETIAQQSQQVATAASAQALQERIQQRAGSVAGNVGNFLWQFTPPAVFATDYNVAEFAKKYIGNVSMLDGESETLLKINGYYRSLKPEEQVSFVKTMYDDLRNTWAITDTGAALMVAEMIAGEDLDGWDKAFDTLQLAAIPLTAIPIASGVVRGMRNIGRATKGMSPEVKIAQAGGKDIVVVDTAQRVAAKGAMQIAGAITGATDLVDTARLVTMASSKVLPSTITTATTAVADIVKGRVEKTLAELAETIKAKNVREGEEVSTYRRIQEIYSPATNKEIHTYLPDTAEGTGPVVFWKPANESAYITKEAAEAAIKLKDPTGALGMRVVPDTTNVGYLVEDATLATRKAQRAQLEVDYVKENAKKVTLATKAGKIPVGPPAPAPAALLSAKPRYSYKTSQFDLNFESMLDKAIYQAGSRSKGSKSDPDILSWIGKQVGKTGNALTTYVNTEAGAIRNFLKGPASKLAGGSLNIPTRNKTREESIAAATSYSNSKLEAIKKQIDFLDQQIAAMEAARKGLVHGYLIEQKIPVPASTYNDLAPYRDTDIQSMVRMSVGDWALGTSSELYANRVVGLHQSSRYQKLLVDMVRKPLEALNRGEQNVLASILIKGDKESKLYDAIELAGLGANTKVMEAYFATRSARNVLHKLRDEVAVRSLTNKGYKQITVPITLDTVQPLYARPLLPQQVAQKKRVYSVLDGSGAMYDEKMAAQGLVLYELRTPISVGGKKYKTIATPATAVKEEPITSVIPFREGEFKRIYSDQYFVKYRGTDEVDGEVTKDVLYTHRTASTRKEGEEYAAVFNSLADLHRVGKLTISDAAKMQPYGWKPQEFIDALNEGKFGVEPKMEVVFTRTEDDYVDGFLSTRQGEFYSERNDRIVNVNGDDVPNTLSPLDSLAAEIGNTAYMVPLTEWRDVAVYRWFNTVKDSLPEVAKAMNPEDAYEYMRRERGAYTGNDQMKLFAQRHQDYVAHELNATTRDEMVWEGSMRALIEKIEGKFDNKMVAKTGAMLRNADPATFARTVTFHSFLGGFNPVQLFVQGLNAFNAVSISPLHGMVGVKQATALRLALMSDNPEVWKSIAGLEKLSTLGLTDAEEFADTVKAVRRSGLLDSINSSSLYGAETGKYGLFNKFTRTAGEGSAFFFNRGEEFSRLVSFVIAKREWQVANPKGNWKGDAALNAILERQDDLTQNMTRANQAKWQTGAMSIPTQFMQYQVKIALNLAASLSGNPRAFNKKEAVQLLVGHGLAWGTAGAGVWMGLEEVFGKQTEEWTPEQRLYLNQGLFAGIVNTATQAVTGEEMMLAFGSRFNSFGYWFDAAFAVGNAFTGGDPIDAIKLLTGAPGGAISRMYGNAKFAVDVLTASDDGVTGTELTEAARLLFTGAFSSLSNVEKAYLAQNFGGYIKSKAGDPLYYANENEIKAMYIGIPPVSSADYEKALLYQKDRTRMGKNVAKEAGRLAALSFDAYRAGDKEAAELYRKMHLALVKSYEQDPQLADIARREFSAAWKTSKHRELAQQIFTDVNPEKPALVKPFGEAK